MPGISPTPAAPPPASATLSGQPPAVAAATEPGAPGALVAPAPLHPATDPAPEEAPAARLAEEFDRWYEPLDTLLFGPPHALREALERALRIADACGPPGGPIQRSLFEEIWGLCYHDLAVWLRCLPQILAQRDMGDEAITLCERLAPLFDCRAFLTDRAILLAQAGRTTEALRQAQANVRAFRRDPVVLRKTCETLWALGHAEEALLLYDEVLELTPGRVAAAPPSARRPEEIRP